MQATTATCLAGGSGSLPPKVLAYRWLFASSSSVTDMMPVLLGHARRFLPGQYSVIPTDLINYRARTRRLAPGLFGYIPRPACRLMRGLGGSRGLPAGIPAAVTTPSSLITQAPAGHVGRIRRGRG